MFKRFIHRTWLSAIVLRHSLPNVYRILRLKPEDWSRAPNWVLTHLLESFHRKIVVEKTDNKLILVFVAGIANERIIRLLIAHYLKAQAEAAGNLSA